MAGAEPGAGSIADGIRCGPERTGRTIVLVHVTAARRFIGTPALRAAWRRDA